MQTIYRSVLIALCFCIYLIIVFKLCSDIENIEKKVDEINSRPRVRLWDEGKASVRFTVISDSVAKLGITWPNSDSTEMYEMYFQVTRLEEIIP